MSRLTVAEPGSFQSLYDKWRFRHHFIAAYKPQLQSVEARWVESIRQNGFVEIPDFIDSVTLRALQFELQNAFKELDFELPCLAQSRIDPARHASLLKSHLFASTNELSKQGLTFGKHEVSSLDQVLQEFQPSTLTSFMLRRSAIYRQVWFDERLLRCVGAYLGMIPYLAEAYVRRNFPAPYRYMNHYWHRDLNGSYLLKAFFFLSDCSSDNGPHEFIRGTHKDFDVLNGKRYFDDEEVDRLFPIGSPRRVVSEVKAGTLIIEDTRGVHRARVPNNGFRDLGYAVFLPLSRRVSQPLYTLKRSVYEELTEFQRAFVPPHYVI
jgi:hypothetical protein